MPEPRRIDEESKDFDLLEELLDQAEMVAMEARHSKYGDRLTIGRATGLGFIFAAELFMQDPERMYRICQEANFGNIRARAASTIEHMNEVEERSRDGASLPPL